MRLFHSVTAVFAAVLIMAGAANADTLKVDGVFGPETASASSSVYNQGLQIESWSWGASNSGGATRPPSSGVVNVVFKRGFAGRQALRAMYDENRQIPAMTLTTTERGKTVKYKLERVFIKSWSTSGDADDRPTEEVAFYYNKIG